MHVKVFFIALKQLLFRKQQMLIAIFGIALGTAGMITLTGVMMGFEENAIRTLNEVEPQIRITPKEFIKNEKSLSGYFPERLIHWVRKPFGKSELSKFRNLKVWENFLKKEMV